MGEMYNEKYKCNIVYKARMLYNSSGLNSSFEKVERSNVNEFY